MCGWRWSWWWLVPLLVLPWAFMVWAFSATTGSGGLAIAGLIFVNPIVNLATIALFALGRFLARRWCAAPTDPTP